MQQYQIQAIDNTDENTPIRRADVRPAHLEYLKKYKEQGNFIMGGAVLDDDGKVVGSTLFMQFETEDELHQYFEKEPFVLEDVWANVRYFPFRMATV